MAEARQAKRVELILRQLEQLPALPAVALRVLEATADPKASLPALAKLIESDPALTASLLHCLRRADLGVREEIASVERAVVLLGLEAVRAITLAVTVFDTLQTMHAPESGFNREEFWKHSIAVGSAAELLAEGLVESHGAHAVDFTPSDAFICGLLHDIGKAALDAVLPKSFAKVVEAADLLRGNIADLERTVIGLDHMIIGKRLAERWELPTALCECIWLHGQAPQSLPMGLRHADLVNLITLADLLAREQHLGYSGNYSFDLSRDDLMAEVGTSSNLVEAAMAALLERVQERAAVLNLPVPPARQLQTEAIKRANQELGRVSTQLALKNRKLAARSRFFDLLGAFQNEMRADAEAQPLLTAIGQSALAALELKNVAVFSLAPGEAFAESMLVNDQGVMLDTALLDCPNPPAAATGPVLPAGDDMDWLLSSVGPRLMPSSMSEGSVKQYWICLTDAGRCVGGVVWAAGSSESQRLGGQASELSALAGAWKLGLRIAQVRQESRRLAERLAQSNRELASQQANMQRAKLMVSVGEMAAGAAHEMNNPLAVIAGRAQQLAGQLNDAKLQATAQLIEEQSHRISEIISELMDFAAPARPIVAACELADVLGDALAQAKARGDLADRTIETTVSDVPPVAVDRVQVAAALTEVIDNALLATDHKGGHVEIHAAFDPVSRNVALTVSDDGVGMDDTTLKRAFDPFFSSKPAGRRRGLGLAKAQRWIAGSGGTIKLESRPGRGTRAVILLPAAEKLSAANAGFDEFEDKKTAL